MEKILNFNEPLDVNLIDAVVGAFYGINAAEVCDFFLFSIVQVEINFHLREQQLRRCLHNFKSTLRHGLGWIQF